LITEKIFVLLKNNFGFKKSLITLFVLIKYSGSLKALQDICSIYQCFCIKLEGL